MNPFYIVDEDKDIRFTAIDVMDGVKSELQYIVPMEYLPQSIKDQVVREQKVPVSIPCLLYRPFPGWKAPVWSKVLEKV